MPTNHTKQTDAAAPAAAPPRVKLLFLDGMRGLAALYVLLFHLYNPEGLPAVVRHGLSWLRFGHYAVGVFIVLSGYSLMLPVVRAADGRIPGGTLDFFKRRARRILPPYYAAVICSLGILLLARAGMNALRLASRDNTLADQFSPGDLVTHLLLIHNWFPRYFGGINGTHWSVAAEWQIYFLFPFLLLPIWRRFGGLLTFGVALTIGILPLLLLLPRWNLNWTCPQYIGLFAMGMVGATINFSQGTWEKRLLNTVPWGIVSGVLFCAFVLIADLSASGMRPDAQLALRLPWTMDVLIGMVAVSFIICCAKALTQGAHRRAWLLRPFESRWATGLGIFSYSIYLMSMPIETKLTVLFTRVCHSSAMTTLLMLVVGAPVTLFLCYLFHLAFERRFMRNLSLPEKASGEVFLSGKGEADREESARA